MATSSIIAGSTNSNKQLATHNTTAHLVVSPTSLTYSIVMRIHKKLVHNKYLRHKTYTGQRGSI
ncbi:hypothetical protein Syun_029896 [Stephania yunnanensis]|uniref:Uncharacterized protein n=1 Tax=Stephania yunnanensis TaxID=152371 RepID=A0AAP0E9S6_9MAGN